MTLASRAIVQTTDYAAEEGSASLPQVNDTSEVPVLYMPLTSERANRDTLTWLVTAHVKGLQNG